MNIFIVFCKESKKLQKYIKINKIRNKIIIDIRKICEEELITNEEFKTSKYHKILIYKKILLAKEKNKDIYYIPNVDVDTFNIEDMLMLKTIITEYTFNLLCFYNDVPENINIINQIHHFDCSQIIEDY